MRNGVDLAKPPTPEFLQQRMQQNAIFIGSFANSPAPALVEGLDAARDLLEFSVRDLRN